MPTDFEMIQMEIQVYLNPELVTFKFNQDDIDKKLLDRYSTIIHVLNQAAQKMQRYEVIFRDFYPSAMHISAHEALEHHIHAYLSDVTILRNAINRLIGTLKHDVLKIASNKAEMMDFFEQCKRVTHKRFNEVTALRDAHNHAENRFLDPDITRSKGISTLTQENSPFQQFITPETLQRLKDSAETSLQRSKEEWCQIAARNAEGVKVLIDLLFISMSDPLYRCLKIEPILRDKVHKPEMASKAE